MCVWLENRKVEKYWKEKWEDTKWYLYIFILLPLLDKKKKKIVIEKKQTSWEKRHKWVNSNLNPSPSPIFSQCVEYGYLGPPNPTYKIQAKQQPFQCLQWVSPSKLDNNRSSGKSPSSKLNSIKSNQWRKKNPTSSTRFGETSPDLERSPPYLARSHWIIFIFLPLPFIISLDLHWFPPLRCRLIRYSSPIYSGLSLRPLDQVKLGTS